MRFGGQEMLLLFLIVLLLFGAARLPRLARSLREAKDEFQKGTEDAAVPQARPDNPEPAPDAAAPSPDSPKPAGLQTDPQEKA